MKSLSVEGAATSATAAASRLENAKKLVWEAFDFAEVNSGVFSNGWLAAKGRETIECASPIDGSSLGRVAVASAEDYEQALEQMAVAAAGWAAMPAPKRGEIIKHIADELLHYKRELGLLVSLEAGKTLIEGQGEVQEMIDIGYLATGLSRQLYGLTIASERIDHRMYEQWLPLGMIGIITAFNFPCAVWSWNAFIAGVVGDTAMWKPSSSTPLVAIATTKIVAGALEELHAPAICGLLVGSGGTVGSRMLADARLPLVSFTGSVATGTKVSEAVARRLGRSILELGGNNGVIVSEKANQSMALKGVAFGALATAGQRCTSTRRLILRDSIYDEFLSRLTDIYREVVVSDPLAEGTLVGPLIDEAAVSDFLAAVEEAQAQGGKLLFGGERVTVPGCEAGTYVSPTLIEAQPDMAILKEETFAPILYVLKYREVEEALQLHNAVPQGLSSAMFTTDLIEEEYFLSHHGSDCGLANVNTSTAGAEIGGAFGGEKETGGGREAGSDAWKIYARRQTVTINHGADLPLAQGVEFKV
jgi:aldehyde dehydrogenase (NAD+)